MTNDVKIDHLYLIKIQMKYYISLYKKNTNISFSKLLSNLFMGNQCEYCMLPHTNIKYEILNKPKYISFQLDWNNTNDSDMSLFYDTFSNVIDMNEIFINSEKYKYI